MGRLVLVAAITANGAFEAPAPAPDGWLVLDDESQRASLEMWRSAAAMVLGRPTYEGLAAVWPQLASVPGFEEYAHQMNSMPKYVASRTLSAPLDWNATLLTGDAVARLAELKAEHSGDLIVSGMGSLARDLLTAGVVDQVWMNVNPSLIGGGPQVFGTGPDIRMTLLSATTYGSGVVQLRYLVAH
ncbi:deaminase [Nakamurella sp. YIM 132087]|uniref:Deaminase n=1 Tax=Nakamurella alba TaxID=2665158 RepID=A0A7K1FRV1_9ACTN|nr:dihydrofolate reductase family protein [Nakamurella alba]MTD16877.1 deaminase [Nakamurella alba]